MPTGQTSLQFVTVGDPGNAADPVDRQPYGAVPYTYQMGKYDVTVAQYCQFLNAVAKTDTYGLYNAYMGTALLTIRRWPSPKAVVRAATATRSLAATARQPIVRSSVSRGAMRPASATGCKMASPPGPGAGHDGNRGVHAQRCDHNAALMAITRNAGATYFIPSENEWYKAAYLQGRRNQCRLLALPHAEQHGAEQRAFRDRHEQRQLLQRRLHRPDESADAGRGICGIAWSLRHV